MAAAQASWAALSPARGIATLAILALAFLAPASLQAGPAAGPLRVDPDSDWKITTPFYAGKNYYTVSADEDGTPLLRARYSPPRSAAGLGRRLERPLVVSRFSWKWRVARFPAGADERIEGRMDNAAAVYLVFASGLRRYAIKYVWSLKYTVGENWRAEDGPFEKMQLVVLRGPAGQTGVWREESVDVAEEFRRYFGQDALGAALPVAGIGVLTDGDGTRSAAEADYARFTLYP
jgi:hypothetical protein